MLDYKFDFSAASQLKRYPSTGIDVLIAGGGPGGMFAAMHCYRKGHNVRVLELGSRYDANGGFIRLGGSIIDHLEMFPGLHNGLELMTQQQDIYSIQMQDGETFMGPRLMPKGGGVSNAGMNLHRSSLNRCLYEYVAALGIEVVFESHVSSYFEKGDKAGVITKSGKSYEADVVIAADGIHSHSAEIVKNEGVDGVAKSSGYAVYRCTYSAEEAYKITNVEKRFHPNGPGTGSMQLWLAKHGYAVIFGIDEVVNFHLIHPDQDGATERWDNRTAKDGVLAFVKSEGFSDDIRDMVTAAPEDSMYDWRLMFRNPKPNWVSEGGHVVQLGDAAHTFLPSSGNGATQALEDGPSIATCLQLAGKSQIPLALKVHNKLRFERTSCAQKSGFRNRDNWIGVTKEEALQKIRNQVGSWITSHDPEAYAYANYGRCVDHLLSGAPFQNDNIPPGHKYRPWSMEDFLSGTADSEHESGDWN